VDNLLVLEQDEIETNQWIADNTVFNTNFICYLLFHYSLCHRPLHFPHNNSFYRICQKIRICW